MDRSESIVCDTLRKLCPERDWMYLEEVEHWEISKMVGLLTETYRSSCDQLKAENAKLRNELADLYALLAASMPSSVIRNEMMERIRKRFRELGVEVEGWPR